MSETDQPADDISDGFVRENRQHIRTLVESLVSMDEEPDPAAVDEAFRAAHSLKANCELVGLDDAGAVAHAVEDVLGAVRAGNAGLDEATAEEAAAAVEAIERVVDGVRDEEGHPTIDADGWRERLRSHLAESHAGDAAVASTAANDDSTAANDDDTGIDLDELDLDEEAQAAFEAAADYDDLDALVAAMDDEAEAYADLEGGGSFDTVEAAADDETGTATADGSDTATGEADAAADAPPQTEATEAGGDAIHDRDPDAPGATTAETPRPDLPAPAPDLAPSTARPTDPGGPDGPSDGVAVPGLDGTADAAATIATSSLDADRFDIDDEGHEPGTESGPLGAARSLAIERRRLVTALDEAGLDGDVADALTSLRVATDALGERVAGDLRRLDALAPDLERAVERAARHVETPVAFEATLPPLAVDRAVVDRLSEPLVHCVRNAVDHGIEEPRERGAAGKPEAGTVTVRSRRDGERLVVSVADDGRGIDADAVREAALDAGIEGAADATDDEVRDLLFEAGLSTADADSDLSGRGVGMDVVGRTMADLGGDVSVDSTPGEGTTVRFSVPVAEVVETVHLVAVGSETYAVPRHAVERVVPASEARVQNGAVQVAAGELERDAMGTETAFGSTVDYRTVDLATALAVPDARPGGESEPAYLLVDPEPAAGGTGRDETAGGQVALRCDGVLSEHETLVTPLPAVEASPAVDGAVVCDSGAVVPVVDPVAFTAGR